jgi:hypothetical protein
MRTEQLSWTEASGWKSNSGGAGSANLVLYFGKRKALANGARYDELRAKFPGAHLLGCSTGGQIRNRDIIDDEIAAVALNFNATTLKLACAPAEGSARSRLCGEAIGRQLAGNGLAGIFVLSDGLNVNGSELVAGIASAVGLQVPLSGGLAGDGADFESTLVGGDCAPRKQLVAAVGFYGNAVRFGHGSAGGWDEFGPHRRITRSQGNVLFELDGTPALDIYKRYLAEDAAGLPGTALQFPLRIRDPQQAKYQMVRTVLAVDHKMGSMTFAGDMPQGWAAQFMHGNFTRLTAGAADAARQAVATIGERDGVAIMVSCIGRRLLMGHRTIDEVSAAGTVLGTDMPRLGFYSYGEITPTGAAGSSQLQNQTMTVTTISEIAA